MGLLALTLTQDEDLLPELVAIAKEHFGATDK